MEVSYNFKNLIVSPLKVEIIKAANDKYHYSNIKLLCDVINLKDPTGTVVVNISNLKGVTFKRAALKLKWTLYPVKCEKYHSLS